MYLLDIHTVLQSHIHTVITIKSFSSFLLLAGVVLYGNKSYSYSIVIQEPRLIASSNLTCSYYSTITDLFFQLAKITIVIFSREQSAERKGFGLFQINGYEV